MLTLIHGSDIASSRKFFIEQKKTVGAQDVVSLLGEQVNLTDLAQILEGGELFATEKHVFIEQFLSKKKKSKERDAIVAYLNKQAAEHTIVIWEDKELDRSAQNLFKKAVIRDFKLPQTLFAFLDSIRPNNGKQMIELFHKTIATTEVEMVFFMLVRQFRMLLALTEISEKIPPFTKEGEQFVPSLLKEGQGGFLIDELKRLAPWQKTKLENQAKLFAGREKDFAPLRDLYAKLFQIELGQKTGHLAAPLTPTIDFFLLDI
jgi:hypothetical protein